jgi:hypothetical protein
MTLPVTISTTALWSAWTNARHGPFQNGTDLYAFFIDATANKVRAYRSTDRGHTWTEQDATNAPASGTTAATRSIDGTQNGATVYLSNILSSSSVNVLVFDMGSDTWQTAIAGPTITLSLTGRDAGCYTVHLVCPVFFGDLVLLYQGADQTVMGTAYARTKVHTYDVGTSTWAGPFDVHGSADAPLANTLPGDQSHHRPYGIASGAYVHLFYGDSATQDIRQRPLDIGGPNFLGAAGGMVIGGTDNVTDNGVGMPTALVVNTLLSLVLPYAPAASASCKVARCGNSIFSENTGNWVQETVADFAGKGATSGSGVVGTPGTASSDGAKAWVWLVASADQALFYADDDAAGAWTDPTPWKAGTSMVCGGVNTAVLDDGSGVGILYAEQSPARVRYDKLLVLQASAEQNPGLVVSDSVDLGQAGPNDVTILLSVGAGGDAAGDVEFLVEHSPDDATWAEATRAGCEAGAALRDLIPLTGVDRYLRLSTTVSGAASDVGAAGA